MSSEHRTAVLFVCTGNICRSVTAEGVFRKMVDDAGLGHAILADSAGTHGYHVGDAPDPRTQVAARRRGYDLSGLRARRIERRDFARFDLLLAMDDEHYRILAPMASELAVGHKVRMMMSCARHADRTVVPDPYYGGPEGFELVLDLLEDGCAGLLARLRADIKNRP